MKGIRVYSWSPMEQKAFEGFFYEAKKLATMYGTNIGSTWSSMIPAVRRSQPGSAYLL